MVAKGLSTLDFMNTWSLLFIKLLEYLNDNIKPGDALLASNDIIYYTRDKKIP